MDAWNALKADTHRQYGRFTKTCLLKGFLTRRTFRVVVTMRLCQLAAHGPATMRIFLPFFKILHRLTTHSASMDFPWRTTIGGGFSITHGWGLVLNREARIGSNVTLFHGVTLGRADRISKDGVRESGYPIIEKDVWIGPHAIIVGRITVGEGSRIAGGAFVTTDVPARSLISGNPATIVKTECSPDVMNRAPV